MNVLYQICLICGGGLGVFSLSTSLHLFFGGSLPTGIVASDLIFFAMFMFIAVVATRQCSTIGKFADYRQGEGRSKYFIIFAFVFLLVFFIFLFGLLSVGNPHGDWDARAIWNMHARFIYRGGQYWVDFLTPVLQWSHPDYPLLLPTVVARLWSLLGEEVPIVPIFFSLFFTFSTVGVLVCSLSMLRSKSSGFMAGILLLGTPFFLTHGVSQYADIPIGFYFLITLSLLYMSEQVGQNNACLSLAFLFASLAAWTKNEGMLFLLVVFCVYSLFTVVTEGIDGYLNKLMYVAVGALPLLIVFYFKIMLAPSGDLAEGQTWGAVLTRISDIHRYYQIGRAFVSEAVRFNHGILFVLVVVFFWGRMRLSLNKGCWMTALVLTLMLIGYFFVYLLSPRDLYFHLGNSLDRIFLQLWPSMIFLFFLISYPAKRLPHSKA